MFVIIIGFSIMQIIALLCDLIPGSLSTGSTRDQENPPSTRALATATINLVTTKLS